MSNEKIQQLVTNGYEFKLTTYISDGFNLLFKRPGMFIGYLLVFLIISFVAGMIPFAGILIRLAIAGPLAIAYAIVANKIKHGEVTVFRDFFDGFQKTVPLLLQQLLIIVLGILVAIPMIVYMFVVFADVFRAAGISAGSFASSGSSVFLRDPSSSRELVLTILQHSFVIFLLAIPLFLLGISYAFAPLFVYFKNMDAWEAMEASRKVIWKRLLYFILFFFLVGLINILGAICLFIGLLFTVPASSIALYAAFDDIVGAREKDADDSISEHFVTAE